jgi:hypothetical protein
MANNPRFTAVGSAGNPLTELQPLWNNLTKPSGPGPVLTASGNSGTTLIQTWAYRTLLLTVYLGGTVSGSGASLTVALAGFALDLPGQQQADAGIALGQTSALTTSGAVAVLEVGPGLASNHIVPGLVQVQWTITGSSPSLTDTEITLWGR